MLPNTLVEVGFFFAYKHILYLYFDCLLQGSLIAIQTTSKETDNWFSCMEVLAIADVCVYFTVFHFPSNGGRYQGGLIAFLVSVLPPIALI